MKIKWDERYLKPALYAFLTIALSIVFYQILGNIGYLLGGLKFQLGVIKKILSPFIIGAFIAYLLNPGVRWFEESLYGKINQFQNKKRILRILSIVTVYLILIGMVTMVTVFVAPQIGSNIADILKRVPEYVASSSDMINQWTEKWSAELRAANNIYDIADHLEQNIKQIFDKTSAVLQYILNNAVLSIMSITSGVFNFVLGIVISFYLLNDKESFKVGTERLLRALLKDRTVDRLKDFGREADNIFAKFIIGKSLDSFIIGVICFIGLSILKIRYALLLSVIVGITNMIPYFGPFIGAVPAVIITFFDSPIKALTVIIFIFALQQFDGLILGPKILGDSVGLSPFWIVFSIVLGGGLYGVIGMFIGVPIIAIIRMLVNRLVDWLLERKKHRTNLLD